MDGAGNLSISRTCLLSGIGHLSSGHGEIKIAILVSLLENGLVRIPAMLLMKLAFGLYGEVFAANVTTAISTIAALCCCHHAFRREVKQSGGHADGCP
ncbi:MAG: hypothetical protein ACI4OY_12060 [Aristaeellaceae bacterium]